MDEVFFQLTLAVILGGVIGIERRLAGKVAGVRTYALVALGACLFSLMSKNAFVEFSGISGFDPSRIASQVVVGIGFLGAGLIVFQKNRVQGLTTAAGLWVTAAIGMAIAYKFYDVAIFATFLTLVIFVVLWHIERVFLKNLARTAIEHEDESHV